MSMSEEQKIYYINNVCKLCSNYLVCDKDRFITSKIYDKISIKCLDYKYKNKEI